MRSFYVEPPPMRHRVEIGQDGERLRIPMRRNWLMIALMVAGLAFWVYFAVTVATFQRHFEMPDLYEFLVWGLGAIFVLAGIVGQLAGSETIRVVGRDLWIGVGVGPLRRTWRYRGGEIENLMGMEPDLETDMWGIPVQRWLFARPKSGAVKFDYGSESIYFAAGVDEPEGREIAAWLARRLPRGAVYGEG